MAIVEGAFFKAGLYAAAALIGYHRGADVPGLGPAIDAFCTALGHRLNGQTRGQATRIAGGLRELARRRSASTSHRWRRPSKISLRSMVSKRRS